MTVCMMFNANKMIGIESRGFIFDLIARDMEILRWQENL